MKNFIAAGVVALLMAGFYALGSTPAHQPVNYSGASISKSVTDTVPKKKDTMSRRDTLPRRDSLQ